MISTHPSIPPRRCAGPSRGYRELSVQLSPGDLVFFYTDGCVETENETGDMFGTERLEELLREKKAGTPATANSPANTGYLCFEDADGHAGD